MPFPKRISKQGTELLLALSSGCREKTHPSLTNSKPKMRGSKITEQSWSFHRLGLAWAPSRYLNWLLARPRGAAEIGGSVCSSGKNSFPLPWIVHQRWVSSILLQEPWWDHSVCNKPSPGCECFDFSMGFRLAEWMRSRGSVLGCRGS